MLVRRDIPLADQIVQVGHACLEAGRRFVQPSAPCHLVVLEVPHRAALLDAASRLDVVGLPYVLFWEPDDALGVTALATRPVTTEQERRLFRRYPLWR